MVHEVAENSIMLDDVIHSKNIFCEFMSFRKKERKKKGRTDEYLFIVVGRGVVVQHGTRRARREDVMAVRTVDCLQIYHLTSFSFF